MPIGNYMVDGLDEDEYFYEWLEKREKYFESELEKSDEYMDEHGGESE